MRQDPIGDDLLPASLNAVLPRIGQAQAALFWRPQYVRNSRIMWQIPFLFWILEISRPRQYVEIGVGEGVTYMAACQSLHRLQADAQCHAVGIWKAAGDQIEVPAHLASRNAELYGHFSQILTEGIESSHRRFTAGSVDVMLVDLVAIAEAGMSLSAAIETLREQWLPKLSEHGILLLHGVGEDESAVAFVDELSGRMPAIQLSGGDGIVVLLNGTKLAERLANLAALPAEDQVRQTLIEMFDRLGAASYYEVSSRTSEEQNHSVDRHLKELRKEYEGIAVRLEESLACYEGRYRQVANLQAKSFDLEVAKDAQRVEIERLSAELAAGQAEQGRLAGEREAEGRAMQTLQESHRTVQAELVECRAAAGQGQVKIERLWQELNDLREERDELMRVCEGNEAARIKWEREWHALSTTTNALKTSSHEEFALNLQATKMLTEALEQNESVVQALMLELRFMQDQLVTARDNEAVLTEALLQKPHRSPLQRFTAWGETITQGSKG
jgi:hypothetical protein